MIGVSADNSFHFQKMKKKIQRNENEAQHPHSSSVKCKDFVFLGSIELHVSKKAILSRLWG